MKRELGLKKKDPSRANSSIQQKDFKIEGLKTNFERLRRHHQETYEQYIDKLQRVNQQLQAAEHVRDAVKKRFTLIATALSLFESLDKNRNRQSSVVENIRDILLRSLHQDR